MGTFGQLGDAVRRPSFVIRAALCSALSDSVGFSRAGCHRCSAGWLRMASLRMDMGGLMQFASVLQDASQLGAAFRLVRARQMQMRQQL